MHLKQFLHPHKCTTIEVSRIIYETESTILIEYDEQGIWLPKSRVTIRRMDGEPATITIPVWLFEKKFG